MYAYRIKKLQTFIKQTEHHILLHQERLNTQYELDKLERTSWLEGGVFRKNEAERELIRLTHRKLKLERQLRKVERRAERAAYAPTTSTKIKERALDARDTAGSAIERVGARTDQLKRWWQHNIVRDYTKLPSRSEGEQVVEQMNTNLKRYFPDEWKRQEHQRKEQAKVAEAGSRYWDERIKDAERAARQQERAAAKKQRKAERTARKEQQQERLEAQTPKRTELTEELHTLTDAIREQERKEPQW